MATRRVRIGGLGSFSYDDTKTLKKSSYPIARPVIARPAIPRPTLYMTDVLDGAGQPLPERAVYTDGAMRSDLAPADDNEVLRKADFGSGTLTEIRLGNWKIVAAANVLTFYYWNGSSWIERYSDTV